MAYEEAFFLYFGQKVCDQTPASELFTTVRQGFFL